MKKVLSLIAALSVIIFQLAIFAFAQATPVKASLSAAPCKPTADGVINANEYGKTFTMDSTNSAKWHGDGTAAPTVSYNFAWSKDGLYLAFSSAQAKAGDTIQINVNPRQKIPAADQKGIFFSFIPQDDGSLKVVRHNYQTPDVTGNTDGMPSGYDISTKVTSKIKTDAGISAEVFIPLSEFKVKGVEGAGADVDLTTLTLSAGDVWGIGTYAGIDGTWWTSILGKDATATELGASAFDVSSLGTLTLATRVELEDSELAGGVGKNSNHAGFSGTGFVDNVLEGGSISIKVNAATAGTYTFTVGYANGNGDAQSLTLFVNGTKVKQLSFPVSGGWDAWITMSNEVALSAGENIIKIEDTADDVATGHDGRVNIDYIDFAVPGVQNNTSEPTDSTPTPSGSTPSLPSGEGGWGTIDNGDTTSNSTNDSSTTKTPPTGDNSILPIITMTLVVSGAAAVAITRKTAKDKV